MSSTAELMRQAVLREQVTQFLTLEARLQDEHEFEAWEKLWTEDAVYWIPANGNAIDPETEMSIVYDNRSRIALRVKQLLTGKRHTQEPRSRLRRLISNIELLEDNGSEIRVGANSMIFESNQRDDTVWAARNEYLLRQENGGLRMAFKKVVLVNNDKPLYTMSFLV